MARGNRQVTNTPFDQRTLAHLLECRKPSDSRRLLTFGTQSLDDSELERRSRLLAAGFSRLGAVKGDRVALLLENGLEIVLVWAALARLGLVSVPLNVSGKAPQLAYFLRNSGARMVVADPQFLVELRRIEGELPVRQIVTTAETGERTGNIPHHLLRTLEEGPESPLPSIHPADPASILYTGGTTGPSKGVICSHGQFYWWARLISRVYSVTESDIWYTPLPFFHVNAQATFLATLQAGGSTVLSPGFSAGRYWDEIRTSKATIASLLGTMAHILFHKKEPRSDDSKHRLRLIFCPAISEDIQLQFERRFGVKSANAYGSTELNCILATRPEEPTRPGSMGRPVEEFEVQVVDENDEPVPVDTTGELVVRPRQPFSILSGYYQMPEQTVKAWRNLWFHTGDRVRRDVEGHFYFVDRLKDCIRRRGENISSWEVEETVNAHPSVLECAAFGVPAELGEEEVMVTVVLRPGKRLDPADLAGWCRRNLPPFALPRYIEIVESLPKTAVGRTEKYKLRRRGVTALTWVDKHRR